MKKPNKRIAKKWHDRAMRFNEKLMSFWTGALEDGSVKAAPMIFAMRVNKKSDGTITVEHPGIFQPRCGGPIRAAYWAGFTTKAVTTVKVGEIRAVTEEW